MSARRAQLVPTYGLASERARPLDKPVIAVGRSGTCDIRLGSVSVAKFHCVIVRDRGRLRIRDISGRGVEVNGRLLREGKLQDGDKVSFGRFRFRVELPEDAESENRPPPLEAALAHAGEADRKHPHVLDKVITLVGSDPDCDLVLEDEGIAPHHCLFARTSMGVYLRDLDGGGRTLVNGEEAEITLLDSEDEILLGPFVFRLQVKGTVELPASEASADVLVVDEDPMNLALLSRMLTKTGYAVRRAATAAECLAGLAKRPADLILMEATLPDMDGLDLCKAVKSDPRWADTSLMFMTGDVFSDASLAAWFEAGACDFLVKPVNRAEVMARVGSRLREKRLQERYREMASVDALTGLMNRRALESRLEQAVSQARRHGLSLSVVVIDLDHFKQCNDTYGHDFGDQVLRGFARVLREGCRSEDIVARHGGEEFCVLLAHSSFAQAKALAERLRQRWEQTPFERDEETIHFTASFGVSCLSASVHAQSDMAPEHLIKEADMALYAAKRRGRNRVVGADNILEAGNVRTG